MKFNANRLNFRNIFLRFSVLHKIKHTDLCSSTDLYAFSSFLATKITCLYKRVKAALLRRY